MSSSHKTSSGSLASVIIVSYNSKNDLEECIPSLISQSYTNKELIVVDNASTDGSAAFVRARYPDIALIENKSNSGYAGGNNIGFLHSHGDYIVIINPDTVAHRDWLKELIRPLENDPDISLTSSKILLYDRRDNINTCANITHYSGLDFCKGFREPSARFDKEEEVGAVSGCSFAIRRSVFDQVGGFDPDFFMYMEDVDISWRARLAGYTIMLAPSSIIYHKFSLKVNPGKIFFLERNRYMMILKNFRLKALLLSLPALLVTEAMTMGYAVTQGPAFVFYKLKAYWWLATNLGRIIEKRRTVQKNIKITEKEFFRMLEWHIPFDQLIENRLLRATVNLAFNSFYYAFYTFVIRRILS
jgi:Predicted glycosyltransferases